MIPGAKDPEKLTSDVILESLNIALTEGVDIRFLIRVDIIG